MAYTTINKSTDHFITHLYSGNDSTNNQTSLGMTPDWVWVKCRNNAIPSHYLVDKVRGDKKYISSNANTAEQTDSNTFDLVSGGFNLAGGNGWTNVTGRNYVAWNWKANGQGSANSDGSVTTTYTSVNTTSGFSISQFNATGSTMTFGHGLGAVPSFMLIKRTDSNSNGNWIVYHKNVGATKFLTLNDSSAETTSSTRFGDTEPTSSVATVGSELLSGGTYIAYCFAEKQGFSKFGSYIGNGNADGAFVYTGFKPAFVMYKNSSVAGGHWQIYDNKRLGYNSPNKVLRANLTNAEADDEIDIVSNGFKCRATNDNNNNHNGVTYIYMAIAEAPLVGSNNVPATAR